MNTFKSNKGFTIIEMVIVSVIILILAAAVVPALSGGKGNSSGFKLNGNAEQDFRRYIMVIHPDANPETIAVSCRSMDTDGDGSVRCTGSVVAPKEYDDVGLPKGFHRVSIEGECGAWISTGCGAVKNSRW